MDAEGCEKWLRHHADYVLDRERSEMGAFASALVGTSSVDNLRACADELARLRQRVADQTETINQLNEAVSLWMDRAGANAP